MSHEKPTISQETPEEYREKCHKFKIENERYYTDNNFYRGVSLPMRHGEPRDEGAKEVLNEVFEHYSSENDNFNLLRYYEKFGDKKNSLKMAESIERNGTLIEKAHAAQQIWKHFKDISYKQKAIESYIGLAEGYEKSGDNLMVAIYNDLLFRISKNPEFREKAIAFHRRFAEEREKKGDTWWQSISLREIGKLSKITQNQDVALDVAIKHANQEIQRAEAAGDFKNAGLWARDIFKLSETPDSRERARKIFLQQIEKSEQLFEASGKSSDLRAVAKSYWEMWKVTDEEQHRQKAQEYYRKLLQLAKDENDGKQKEECCRVLLYITQ